MVSMPKRITVMDMAIMLLNEWGAIFTVT